MAKQRRILGAYGEPERFTRDDAARVVAQQARKCWHEARFDERGNMENGWGRTTVDPVEPFEETLEFDRFQRGRSSPGVTFKREDGREVNVFLKDFAEMIPQMSAGRVTARWRYVKRGQDYGVALA